MCNPGMLLSQSDSELVKQSHGGVQSSLLSSKMKIYKICFACWVLRMKIMIIVQ